MRASLPFVASIVLVTLFSQVHSHRDFFLSRCVETEPCWKSGHRISVDRHVLNRRANLRSSATCRSPKVENRRWNTACRSAWRRASDRFCDSLSWARRRIPENPWRPGLAASPTAVAGADFCAARLIRNAESRSRRHSHGRMWLILRQPFSLLASTSALQST